jgi:hypothetical protein
MPSAAAAPRAASFLTDVCGEVTPQLASPDETQSTNRSQLAVRLSLLAWDFAWHQPWSRDLRTAEAHPPGPLDAAPRHPPARASVLRPVLLRTDLQFLYPMSGIASP